MDYLLLSALLILALATYEIAWMLHDTSKLGPYDMLGKFRSFVGVEYDERSVPYGTSVLSEAMLCMYCSSFWIGLVMALLYIVIGATFLYAMLPLAINGAVILILKGDSR